jgi:hypothetical protein
MLKLRGSKEQVMSLSTGHKIPVRHVPSTGPTTSSSVTWAWGLIGATLPVAVVAVLVLSGAAGLFGISSTATAVGVVLYVAVVAPLVAAIVVGYRGWRREHEPLALKAALFSAWCVAVGTALVVLA